MHVVICDGYIFLNLCYLLRLCNGIIPKNLPVPTNAFDAFNFHLLIMQM